MEQFEKWKSKNCETKNCPHEASCNGCENMWRAALEWVREEQKRMFPHHEDWQGNFIDKELGDI